MSVQQPLEEMKKKALFGLKLILLVEP